ncbi:MAG TPA: SDR family oxidoreductase [Symbiobacteriaceae bacterium]|nr:SDR family oxidoreductase [Symbiobacteriaceae bacterium]
MMANSDSRRRIVIAGATGYLGRYLVKSAHARGFTVRALARSEERLGDVRSLCDEVFVGEATKAESLAGLCRGADFVVSSLGNRTLARKPDCFAVDYQANMNILACAREAGVSHFVFVSVLGGNEARRRVPQIEARERVVDALRAGAVPWTVMRPSGFFNDMSEFLAMAKQGHVWVPGGGARFNPIHGADLAEVCLDAVGNRGTYGCEIPAGGPDVFSMSEIGDMAFGVLGKPPRVSTIPPWVLTAMGTLVRPVNLNLASLILMMGMFAAGGTPCDAYGRHHLRDFFNEIAAAAARGEKSS